MLEKLSKGVEMHSEAHAIDAAGRGVRYLAGQGSVKTRVNRALVYLRGVSTPRRIKAHLYGEVRRQPAHEAEAIRAAVERKRREEITRLRAQIATLEVQQKADLDAMAAQLPTLLGPLYPLAVKAGLVNPEAVAASEDGEA